MIQNIHSLYKAHKQDKIFIQNLNFYFRKNYDKCSKKIFSRALRLHSVPMQNMQAHSEERKKNNASLASCSSTKFARFNSQATKSEKRKVKKSQIIAVNCKLVNEFLFPLYN